MTKVKIDEWVNQMDGLPTEARIQADIERTAGGIARFYGFERFFPAGLEAVSSFSPLVRAGLLEERPPVVCKTRSGEEFLLSPSGALGAVRAYFSHKMHDLPHPVKIFYSGRSFSMRFGPEVFPDGGPVAGRNEWGAVMLGEESPIADAQIAQVLLRTAVELGINGNAVELRLNAIGCSQCRGSFRSALTGYFRSRLGRLCPVSKRDLKRAPTRILSCPEERCAQASGSAPQVLDFLCERCKKQLRGLLEFLDEARIAYFLDTRLFREGSWFTEIVFELLHNRSGVSSEAGLASEELNPALDRGAVYPAVKTDTGGIATPQQDRGAFKSGVKPAGEKAGKEPGSRDSKLVLAEGGRLSQAARILGGKDLHVASGVLLFDAVAAVIREKEAGGSGDTEVFFVQLGELAKRKSFGILEALREGGIEAKESLGRDSIKVQLKIAERLRVRWALILGQKEALDGTVIVREVESGIQETIPQDKLIDFLKRKLKK